MADSSSQQPLYDGVVNVYFDKEDRVRLSVACSMAELGVLLVDVLVFLTGSESNLAVRSSQS